MSERIFSVLSNKTSKYENLWYMKFMKWEEIKPFYLCNMINIFIMRVYRRSKWDVTHSLTPKPEFRVNPVEYTYNIP